jgi:uncharacterized protein YfaS (alpha-2-macroglobulin family)
VHKLSVFAVLVAAAAVASCGPSTPAAVPLAPVAALPKPSLPPWIASVSPVGEAQSLAQIRVIFAKPVVRVEALSGSGTAGVLGLLHVEPALRGRFTLLTPRMIGFVAEQALPVGTRVRVTLAAGMSDLAGDRLDRDLAWTFETKPLALRGLPQLAPQDGSTPPPVGLQPVLRVAANAAVDVSSLASHAVLVGGGDRVPLTVTPVNQPTPIPGSNAAQLFDPSLNDWSYELRPQRALRTATTYRLAIAAGVAPAYGNVPTARAFHGAVHTYDPLAVVATPTPSSGQSSRFAGGDPAIAFNNPLDPKSIPGAVTISPSPVAVKTLVSLSDDRSTLSIDPYALDPDRTYVATVAAGVKDVFGQTLGQAQRVTIRTGDFAAGAWAPTGTSVIPAGAPVDLNFYATNLPKDAYQAAFQPVKPLQMLGYLDPLKVLPGLSAWPAQRLTGARRNAQSVVRVPLRTKLGGPYGALAYGFRTALDGSGSAWMTGVVQLTDLGIFAQWFPQHGMVLVQRLSDGAPAAGTAIAIYRMDPQTSVPLGQCAAGSTDRDGEFDVSGVDVERCYAGAPSGQAPSLGVIATQGADVATLTTQSYSGVYRFNVNGGWTSGAPLSAGTMFTDRQLYQPGERGEVTGIAYYVSGSRVVADRNAAYRVTLQDPSNNTVSLGTVHTDAYGVFSLPIVFSKQQALGYYTIDAKGANGNDINGSLRVAEFKPPNFKMTLSLNADSARAGASITANAAAAYLFGAPLQGGTAHADVTRQLAMVQPKGWDDYWFGRQWFWPEQTPSFDTDVLQRDLPLDAQGQTSLQIPVPSDLPFPMTYTVDVAATDVSHLSVADTKSFLALPAGVAIGLRCDVVGPAGTPMPVRVIVTDAGGHPVAGRTVTLQLQSMTYTSATQQIAGGESAQQSIEYRTVATASATSGAQPVSVDLTPPSAGSYRLRANFADAAGDASATDVQIFAFGAGQADWGLSDPNAVKVKLDKKSYAVGDTATALVAVPFSKADVYVSVIRGDTLLRAQLRNVGGAQRFSFKITPDMLPNAAFEALVVRRGSALATVKPGTLGTLSRVGMTGFEVGLKDRYLQLHVTPMNATVQPGGGQQVTFKLDDARGRPARGEIVAMAVDEAILQLSGYRLPDLVQTVFADQPISTVFADSRDGVVLQTQRPPLEKGFGYGGGYLAGAASTRVRQQFKPLAYYGVVKTDASGNARVAFNVPDNLTTWRVMAVAIGSDDAHFGGADATFVSSQPLMLNPLLPQFARPGDRFDLGVSASNQTGASGALALVLQLTGSLSFASGAPSALSVSEPAATGMQAWRFPVIAGTPAPATVEASGKLGSQSDAFKVPFETIDRGVTESVIESGAVSGAAASVPIALNRGGVLNVTLANSIVPQFAVPSNAQMQRDALPFADDAASRLQIASALAPLRAPYRLALTFDPAAAVAKSLQQLYGLQRADGGIAFCAGSRESDPFDTAFALNAMVFARSRGFAVAAGSMRSAKGYLASALANPGRYTWCTSPECKNRVRFEALWALAAAGDRRTDFLAPIVAGASQFDTATQIRLARYLLRTPGWQRQGAAMADTLVQQVYVTGRYAVANVTTRWGWTGSLVDAQSQMLELLVGRHAPTEQLDGAVRALIAQRCACGWPTLHDTATALAALSAYAAAEPVTASSVTVRDSGAVVASAQFGSTAASRTVSLPAASLKGGTLTIAASAGTVHYTLLYTYPVPSDAPGQLAAFRVTRELRSPGTSGVLATMDLAPSAPVTVAAGKVFDVGVRVIVDHPVDHLLIDDPLPAGLEAVDTTFATTSQAALPQSDSWEIDAQQIYRDRVIAYASHLGPGVYELHYLARSVTPGTYRWPGASAYLRDAPEQFGRSAATVLRVTP